MTFFDTSVIVAASYDEHPEHTRCRERLRWEPVPACAAHTLAEVFATLTRLPIRQRIDPKVALKIILRLEERFAIVSLTPEEYMHCIRDVATRGLAGAIIDDALLLSCARKLSADEILTFNLGHFRRLAPDLAHRIVAP